MQKGSFNLDDLATQLQQMRKMGGMGGILGMLPGVGKIKQQLADHQIDDRMIARQLAIIGSMTPKERRNPQILHASRKRRIAAGSGTAVPEVNKLLKQYQQMQTMMKRVKKMGPKQSWRVAAAGVAGIGLLLPSAPPASIRPGTPKCTCARPRGHGR
jgi:signal recognition particle subunit SRP54